MLFCLGDGRWERKGEGYQKNYRIFNKEVSEEVFDKAYNNPEFKLPVSVWIDKKDMSEEEKKKYTICEQIGGYLKVLSYKDAWKEGQIEGLLRDWTRWQERQDKYPIFGTFQRVLQKLGPSDIGQLEIGEPRRILGEVREIPTLVHPYGTVPIVFESAGIKRIATLAYLIVWAWEEHKTQAKLSGRKEERQMVILLDEAEAHLHPKWQRKILPALLDIAEDLHTELSLQIIVATHSPLVMASSEPIFDPEQDQVFHLGLTESGKVQFTPYNFEVRGTVDSWLSSDFFGLKFPGNEKRSDVIQRAISLQQSDVTTKQQVEAISNQLKELLPAEDSFWIRWILYAEQFGVKI